MAANLIRTKAVDTRNANTVVLGSSNAAGGINKMNSAFPLSNTGRMNIADRLYFTMDNSSSTNLTKAFHIFDAIGAVTSLESLSTTAATGTPLSHAILIQYIQSQPLVISGIRIQATTSSTQFNNALGYYVALLDGTVFKKSFYLDDAIEGDKYDEKIQAYSFPNGLLINNMTAFTLTVNTTEKVYITMYVMKDPLKIQSF